MKLCCCLSFLVSLIRELESYIFTCLNLTVCNNEELVIPALTRSFWLFNTSSLSLSLSVLSLLTINLNLSCVSNYIYEFLNNNLLTLNLSEANL